jgi:hypothetical protein
MELDVVTIPKKREAMNTMCLKESMSNVEFQWKYYGVISKVILKSLYFNYFLKEEP